MSKLLTMRTGYRVIRIHQLESSDREVLDDLVEQAGGVLLETVPSRIRGLMQAHTSTAEWWTREEVFIIHLALGRMFVRMRCLHRSIPENTQAEQLDLVW